MNRNFVCSIGLLLAMVGTSQLLVAKEPVAKKNNVPRQKPSSVPPKKNAKKVKQPAAIPAPKIIGAKNRQALIEKRRAEIKAMLKNQGKAGAFKTASKKAAKRRRAGLRIRPRVGRRQHKAKSLVQDLGVTTRYARFIPDPDFGKPHRVNLAAAKANQKDGKKIKNAPAAVSLSKQPHKNAMLKKPIAHEGMS
ncbi:hypothetical protein FJ365_03235 [Candidatus Dependentiae bacterium]|nr:hypothetical protein [Candidatus Dependentiae bacterium]